MRIKYEISGVTITKSTDSMDKVNQLSGQRVLEGTVGQGQLRISGTARHVPPNDPWVATLTVKIVKSDRNGQAVVKEFTTKRNTGGDIPFDVAAPIEQDATYTISIRHVGAYNYSHALDINGTFKPKNK